jgi:hypothetical protein
MLTSDIIVTQVIEHQFHAGVGYEGASGFGACE